MPINPVPTLEDCATAVFKAVSVRRDRHRADPAWAELSTATIAERVNGTMLLPRSGGDGWWLVGRVFDAIADAEFSVWYMMGEQHGQRGVGIGPRPSDPEAVQFTAN